MSHAISHPTKNHVETLADLACDIDHLSLYFKANATHHALMTLAVELLHRIGTQLDAENGYGIYATDGDDNVEAA